MSNLTMAVRVICGRNLAAKDENGLSDPYCILKPVRREKSSQASLSVSQSVAARVTLVPSRVMKTKVIKKSLQPTWNQTFDIGKFSPNDSLKLMVWDHDKFSKDDFMGMLEIPFNHFTSEKTTVEWHPLSSRPGRDDGVSGDIRLQIIVRNASACCSETSADRKRILERGSTASALTTSVYGVKLSTLMDRQKLGPYKSENMPHFLSKLLDAISEKGLHFEGVFRVSPSTAEVSAIIERINKGEDVNFLAECPVPVMTELLTVFLRELPEPLLTYKLFYATIPVLNNQGAADDDALIDVIKAGVCTLPSTRLEICKKLFGLMGKLCSESDKNKMDATNLAVCIGPDALWSPELENPSVDPLTAARDMQAINRLVRIIIEQRAYIFDFAPPPAVLRRPPPKDAPKLGMEADGRRLFVLYDNDNNGQMDREEFAVFYRDCLCHLSGLRQIQEADINLALQDLDQDGNGLISEDEFMEWWAAKGSSLVQSMKKRGGVALPKDFKLDV